jgi:GxxExxY protein
MKHEDITGRIIGAAMQVHRTLGCGFPEVLYQRALEIEFSKRKIDFNREFELPVYYEGQNIGCRRCDFLVEQIISVELKAVSELNNAHLAQALNYLEAFNLEIGLLINFGSASLEYKRLTNNKYTSEATSNPPSFNPSNPLNHGHG